MIRFLRRPLIVLIVFVAANSVRSETTDAWPQFLGPQGNGHGPQSRFATQWSESENIGWKTEIAGKGWSSPAIVDNRIWLTTATEDGQQLSGICVDFESGELLHNRLLVADNQAQEIHTLNSHASPSPVINGERVYLSFGSYGTFCLDSKTGEEIWQRRDLPCNHWRGPGSSPLVYQNLLIMHFDGYDYQYVIALDKGTGKTVWQRDRDVDYGTDDGDVMKAFCTPIVIDVNGQSLLISPTSKAALALDPNSGEVVWRVRYDEFSATARPLFDGKSLFINTGFGKAKLLGVNPIGKGDITDTNMLWTQAKSIGSKPSSVLIDGRLYVVHDQGVLSCLDSKSGEPIWTQRLGGNYSASLLYAGGHVYVCSQEGVTTVFKPGDEYQEVATNQIDGGFMASPAVYQDSLILRSRTHLYRIRE
ncbi:MAG: PQQ-binding-like beta-propeller repeat protein [Planctomycetales bacterium]|nr:PQQ-binding-like beta-propeller repeat protein [Planctomycetales bacterium]